MQFFTFSDFIRSVRPFSLSLAPHPTVGLFGEAEIKREGYIMVVIVEVVGVVENVENSENADAVLLFSHFFINTAAEL